MFENDLNLPVEYLNLNKAFYTPHVDIYLNLNDDEDRVYNKSSIELVWQH